LRTPNRKQENAAKANFQRVLYFFDAAGKMVDFEYMTWDEFKPKLDFHCIFSADILF
jgi:hypothetical protein